MGLARIGVDATNAHVFARALLDRTPETEGWDAATFSLPGLRLAVRFSTEGYADLCRHALVDDPDYAGAPQHHVRVAVFDHRTRPEWPRGVWAEPGLGISELARGLAPGALEGAHDVDHGLWQFYDAATGRGVEAQIAAGRYPPWVGSFPLRNFLHWAYQSIGWRLVHAGTLGFGGSGVMLIGAGGSGKSGTTLSGIAGGLTSVGDDYVAMRLTANGVSAYPVIRLMKQDGTGLTRLGVDPVARRLGEPNWQGKYEFDFEALVEGARARQLDLKAILLPRIARAVRSSFTPVPSRVAMIGLAPSNLQQLPGGWREGLAFTAEVARRLPAYYLDLSEDPVEIAGAIAGFIAGRPA